MASSLREWVVFTIELRNIKAVLKITPPMEDAGVGSGNGYDFSFRLSLRRSGHESKTIASVNAGMMRDAGRSLTAKKIDPVAVRFLGRPRDVFGRQLFMPQIDYRSPNRCLSISSAHLQTGATSESRCRTY